MTKAYVTFTTLIEALTKKYIFDSRLMVNFFLLNFSPQANYLS